MSSGGTVLPPTLPFIHVDNIRVRTRLQFGAQSVYSAGGLDPPGAVSFGNLDVRARSGQGQGRDWLEHVWESQGKWV